MTIKGLVLFSLILSSLILFPFIPPSSSERARFVASGFLARRTQISQPPQASQQTQTAQDLQESAEDSQDSQQPPPMKIGEIEFFGYQSNEQSEPQAGGAEGGTSEAQAGKRQRDKRKQEYSDDDLKRLRETLPVKEGDRIKLESIEATVAEIKRAVRQMTGRDATDINLLCCDDRGDWQIFIGLPGPAYRPFQYNPKPRGTLRLPADIVALVERTGELASEAARNDPREDRSKGYALSMYPPMREVQMRVREYAVTNAALTRRVLNTAADARHRRAAAYALGYAPHDDRQVSALANAARDSDNSVRNDATRALGVIASANPKIAARIPPANFVAMLNSGSWSDRNKSGLVLSVLTARRDPALLRMLRKHSLGALIEMARWRNAGHAFHARIILGRVAGFEEKRLQKLANEGKVEEIVRAVRTK